MEGQALWLTSRTPDEEAGPVGIQPFLQSPETAKIYEKGSILTLSCYKMNETITLIDYFFCIGGFAGAIFSSFCRNKLRHQPQSYRKIRLRDTFLRLPLQGSGIGREK